jgi:hypothetical protein
MGFLVSEFQGLDYVQYKNLYVTIQSFSINRVANVWMCRFFLQAHKTREEKRNGVPGFFLSYYNQTAEIEIKDLTAIITEIYAKAKELFGVDICTDVLNDSVQAPIDIPPAPQEEVVTAENVVNDAATA